MNPTRSAMREPQITWLKMSRPWLSRPSQYWFPLGYPGHLRSAGGGQAYVCAHEGSEGARNRPSAAREETPTTVGPPYATKTARPSPFGASHARGIPGATEGNVLDWASPPSDIVIEYRTPWSSAGFVAGPLSSFATVSRIPLFGSTSGGPVKRGWKPTNFGST